MKRSIMVAGFAYSLAFVLTGCATQNSGVSVAGCKKPCR